MSINYDALLGHVRSQLADPDGRTWSDIDILRAVYEAVIRVYTAQPYTYGTVAEYSLDADRRAWTVPAEVHQVIRVYGLVPPGSRSIEHSLVFREDAELTSEDPHWRSRSTAPTFCVFAPDTPYVVWLDGQAPEGMNLLTYVCRPPAALVDADNKVINIRRGHYAELVDYTLMRLRMRSDDPANRATAHMQFAQNETQINRQTIMTVNPYGAVKRENPA